MSSLIADIIRNRTGGVDFETTDDTTGSFLESHAVDGNQTIAVQAKFENDSRIFVGLTDSPTVELEAGQGIGYNARNTDQIYIKSKSSGDGVNVTAEVEG